MAGRVAGWCRSDLMGKLHLYGSTYLLSTPYPNPEADCTGGPQSIHSLTLMMASTKKKKSIACLT